MKDATSFWKIKEIFIKGNNINCVQIREEVVKKVEEEKDMPIIEQNINTNKSMLINEYKDKERDSSRGRGGSNMRSRGNCNLT